jgi:hypothetical protein
MNANLTGRFLKSSPETQNEHLYQDLAIARPTECAPLSLVEDVEATVSWSSRIGEDSPAASSDAIGCTQGRCRRSVELDPAVTLPGAGGGARAPMERSG